MTDEVLAPSPERALDFSRRGGDMLAVLREAEAQAGYGNDDQLGSNEYERRALSGFNDFDGDDMTRENLGWEE